MSNKWDIRFLEMAKLVASWSKDPSTKVGTIAVRNRTVIAQGYNGFPRGIDDNDRLDDRAIKYMYIVHSEMNAIYNAAENGVSLRDSTMYIYGLPVCSECAKGIIQVGVKRVVAFSKSTPDRWVDSITKTTELFDEAGVEYEKTIVQ